MSFSHDTLIDLLASRHKLYVQLGLIDKYVAAVRDRPMFGTPPGIALRMSNLIEVLEERIGDINRQIAQFRGPIADEAAPAANSGRHRDESRPGGDSIRPLGGRGTAAGRAGFGFEMRRGGVQ